ncbi:MAG: DNA damage-inducible protein D [Patescibacteria group bacterium]
MDTLIISKLHKNFEEHVHEENGTEYWFARDLQKLLGYDRWENFENAVDKARIACKNAKQQPSDHLRDVTKMILSGKGAQKLINDIMLTRYACYLIAQNGDPRKDEIAFAQTYFAVQTRKQEVIVQRLAEWERLKVRQKLSVSEKNLSGILFERNVDHQGFARIRSKGDAALFGGLNTQDMKDKLGVPDKRPLADFLSAVTITAKELANQVTSLNVKRSTSMVGEKPISDEHVKNNKNVRVMLGKSGIRPEELPPEEDIKKISTKINKLGKGKLLP